MDWPTFWGLGITFLASLFFLEFVGGVAGFVASGITATVVGIGVARYWRHRDSQRVDREASGDRESTS